MFFLPSSIVGSGCGQNYTQLSILGALISSFCMTSPKVMCNPAVGRMVVVEIIPTLEYFVLCNVPMTDPTKGYG